MNELRTDTAFRACIQRAFAQRPIKLAYLYGSIAEGNATPLSDVDIALVVDDQIIKPNQRLALELEVEEVLSQVCNIAALDVRVINAAPLMLRGEVVTNGILLYSADEKFRVEFETYTRSLYFDFLPAAEMIRQAFFDRISERGLHG